MAEAIGGKTTHRSLVYRIQAAWCLSVSAPYGRDLMSYKAAASGPPVPVPATVSPKAAFESLFFNFAPSMNPREMAERDRRWRARRSVLDLVKGSADRLLPRLGEADRRRVEQHLEEVRELERRASAIPPAAVGQCKRPMAPTDPPLGGNQGNMGGTNTYSVNLGYSGEEERARAFCDLVHMAFTCDLARGGTLMFTMAQSHMNMQPAHGAGHGPARDRPRRRARRDPGSEQGHRLAHEALRLLVARLRDTPEVGGSVLDHCAVVFLHEGGHGKDTATGRENSSHSTENMACLVAGRAGGLKAGQHIVAADKPPANVLVTAMNAVGVPAAGLGEVIGAIPELRAGG